MSIHPLAGVRSGSFAKQMRLLSLLLLLGVICVGTLGAQTQTITSAKSTAESKSNAEAPGGTNGFSIETEMLTYRALESNSEAIACDVAAYMNGTTAKFDNPPKDAVCDVNAGSHKDIVVLLPFDKTQLADFEIWSSDMATMARLQEAARSVDCPKPPEGAPKRAGNVLSMTPAGPPLELATTALALLSSEQSSTSVGGTIKDQAFMDGVGRELRSLSVPVLMPSAYTPNAMSPLDEQTSPYLSRRAKVIDALGCLDRYKPTGTDDPNVKQVQQTISAIQSFLGSIGEGPSASAGKSNQANTAPAPGTTATNPAVTGQASQSAKPGTGSVSQNGTDTTKAPVIDTAAASSHLSAAMLADGLARQLGVLPATGTFADGAAPLHILLVQALESGGSVIKMTNVLGTRIRYSGGSVGTYALFSASGSLECSGNVYDYGGTVKAGDFDRDLRNRKLFPDPRKQVIFMHSCSPHATPANAGRPDKVE